MTLNLRPSSPTYLRLSKPSVDCEVECHLPLQPWACASGSLHRSLKALNPTWPNTGSFRNLSRVESTTKQGHERGMLHYRVFSEEACSCFGAICIFALYVVASLPAQSVCVAHIYIYIYLYIYIYIYVNTYVCRHLSLDGAPHCQDKSYESSRTCQVRAPAPCSIINTV